MTAEAVGRRTRGQRVLDGVERLGNKVPHPAVIFLALCLLVIVLSAILAAFHVSVTYETAQPAPIVAEETYPGGTTQPGLEYPPHELYSPEVVPHTETTSIKSLLSADGIRFLFTSSVQNFNNFGVVGVILVAMVGVGLAEEAGLIGALIRKLVRAAPKWALTFIIVLLGILSASPRTPGTWSSSRWARWRSAASGDIRSPGWRPPSRASGPPSASTS